MDAQSASSDQKIVTGLPISLPASAAGPTPSNSLAGIQLEMFGPEAVPANHSQSPPGGMSGASQTSGTSGPSGVILSASAVLQLYLESRLRQNLDVNGSLESEMTWRHWDMPSGPPICALRVSGHRTVDNGFTGWPTPDTVAIGDGTDFETQRLALLERRKRTKAAVKAGKTKAGSGRSMTLQMAAQSLSQVSGTDMTSPSAEPSMVAPSTGALNPAFPRWLMGYPAAWDVFEVTETP